MKIENFKVEQWMNEYEDNAPFNIAETCVDSVSLNELFEITGADRESFLSEFCSRRLTYGDITGLPEFKEGIAALYKEINPEDIVVTHGAAGANHHVFYTLINPGDRVISLTPTYQQLYSIPESFGAEVITLPLREEDSFLPDLEKLRELAQGAKLICLNNPNNPTGALIPLDMLEKIVEIARESGSWLLCDETYRHLTQEDSWSASAADLYEKGISVSSMSKVFSLAGLRLGWIACRDSSFIEDCLNHRDYNHISCGMFDEAVASLALSNAGKLLERNRGIVRENLSVLDSWMARQKHLRYVKPAAGTTALIFYDVDMPSYELCIDMYNSTGAFVTPGACFELERCFRIGYACSREVLLEGLEAAENYFSRF